MNKYQKAFNFIATATNGCNGIVKEMNTLKELVDKATPKRLDSLYYKICKEYDEYYVRGRCLTCGNEFTVSKENRPNYCSNCGQKLDWSEETEE